MLYVLVILPLMVLPIFVLCQIALEVERVIEKYTRHDAMHMRLSATRNERK